MLAEAAKAATATVVAALQKASTATGSDFHYLLGTAMRESGLKPHAQSKASSAAGLFQFVEQTWLGLVKEFGAKHGLGSYAGAIRRGADARYHVDNAADRQAILALRNDPQASALMAGEYTKQTQSLMQGVLGRPVCAGELYAAHFLGPESACRLIQASESAPATSAASLFPQAASANKNIFYTQDGSPRTVRDVYNWAVSGTASPSSAGTTVTQASMPSDEPTLVGRDTSNYADVLALLWTQPAKTSFSSASSGLLSSTMLDVISSLVGNGGPRF